MSNHIYNFEEVIELNDSNGLNKRDHYLNNTHKNKLNKLNYIFILLDEGFSMREDFDLKIKNFKKLKEG